MPITEAIILLNILADLFAGIACIMVIVALPFVLSYIRRQALASEKSNIYERILARNLFHNEIALLKNLKRLK